MDGMAGVTTDVFKCIQDPYYDLIPSFNCVQPLQNASLAETAVDANSTLQMH